VTGALGITDPPTFGPGNPPGLYENTTVTATLVAPATGGAVHFTTNTAHPTRYSEVYAGPVTANRTKVVRAIAAKEGYLPSASITRSFLFKEDILGTAAQGTPPTDHQGARDPNNPSQFKGLLLGYPESSEMASYPLRYEMHPDVVRDKKNTLSAELSAVPVVSVVSPVGDLLDLQSAGIYPNSGKTDAYWPGRAGPDPRSRNWVRQGSFEFIEKDKSNFIQGNACLSMTGGSSLYQDVTRKHNLRVRFDSTCGPSRLLHR
jgi:hypothetical protein